MTANTNGLVLAAYGRQFLVKQDGEQSADQAGILAVSKGRNADITVGDRVVLRVIGGDQAIIDQVLTRRNQLHRSTGRRDKVLAANIDLTALVIAPQPRYSEAVVIRVGMAARAADIDLLIIANKADAPEFADIEDRLACYERIGIKVLRISAKSQATQTRALMSDVLRDKTTLLLGESGMGKSTLLNVLVPDAGHKTAEISAALGTGKHTTTFSRLFTLDDALAANARLIDSPGFQQFGIAHLSASQREHAMPEFSAYLGKCKFHNCTHQNEPACAITQALAKGQIDRIRYKIFSELGESE